MCKIDKKLKINNIKIIIRFIQKLIVGLRYIFLNAFLIVFPISKFNDQMRNKNYYK